MSTTTTYRFTANCATSANPSWTRWGGFNSWFFHDADADLDEWLANMEVQLELLLVRGPSEVDVYEESV
ncbi:hypothetical protein ACFWSJ_24895 [Streptomyces niveus]|uniref:hypothetical protein n=1 Tax=Streptomyces niveus TaxID=193462 RepID=UPI0036510C4F